MSTDISTETRRRIMRVLARADAKDLETALSALAPIPDHSELRQPESGLVMVRGRVSGAGGPFNLGEATVTRAAVRLATGEVGVSYMLGRDGDKARRAALIEALSQSGAWRGRVERDVIAPIERRLAAQDAKAEAKTAATRVDFFTLVRGED